LEGSVDASILILLPSPPPQPIFAYEESDTMSEGELLDNDFTGVAIGLPSEDDLVSVSAAELLVDEPPAAALLVEASSEEGEWATEGESLAEEPSPP
jgi:hypothetical protein